MAKSPTIDAEGVVRLHVTVGGSDLPPTVQLRSVSVQHGVNSVPSAVLVISDGDVAHQAFEVGDSALLAPGAEVAIALGYGDGEDEQQVFSGVVVRFGLKITGENDSRLVVECRDKAAAMTLGRRNANHVDVKDGELITKLIQAHGLGADVESTVETHGAVVQHYCSDWDFMLSRADANGHHVVVTDGKVSVKAPDTEAEPELMLTYGVDIMAFHADIDARTQLGDLDAVGWDPKTQQPAKASARAKALGLQGDLDAQALSKVVGPPQSQVQSTAALSADTLTQWAKSCQLKAGLARVRGRVKFQGHAAARAGSTIELVGVGKRFSGRAYIGAVHHEAVDGNWVTEVEFGLAPDWFVQRNDVLAPPAGGLLPGVHGLQIGIVTKIHEDPLTEARIQVRTPALDSQAQPVWARLASFHASAGIGAFFLPEVADEVVIGYLNDDPDHPVVLGSLYSSKRKPPYTAEAKNNIKAIVTRCNSKIEFDEEDKLITITTPANNVLIFSDKDKSICVHDENGNKVELTTAGISLSSPKDIVVNAKGKVTIDAIGNIALTSKADVVVKGLNVNAEAQVGLSAKGTATAELSAAGQTTVKGAMVMIN